MIRKNIRFLLVLFCYPILFPITVAYAQDPVTVTGVKTPKLIMFLDENSNSPTQLPKPGNPSTEITNATCCNARMMVHLTALDENNKPITGWVLKQHLAIKGGGKKLTAGCDEIAAVQVGSTRGAGEGCQ